MRFSNGVTAALLSLSVEANSVRLPYVKRADNVTAGIPPPPGTYIPVPTFFSTNSTRSKGGATSYPLDLDTQTAYSPVNDTRSFPLHEKALDAAGHKDYPLIAGVVSQQFEEAIEQLNPAKSAGVVSGAILCCRYIPARYHWFTAIADKSPMPILIYGYPVVTNNIGSSHQHTKRSPNTRTSSEPKLPPQTFRGTHRSLPIRTLTTCIPTPTPGLASMLAAVTLGVFGALDVVGTAFPKSMVHLYKLSSLEQPTPKQRKEARDLQWKVATTDNVVGIKAAVNRVRGFGDRNGVRPPLLNTITDDQWDAFSDIINIMIESGRQPISPISSWFTRIMRISLSILASVWAPDAP
ncbi:hypothetical protein F4824DRAFT_496080 [Ustulina deusta]|nr:hypothetical protein F4824DRAFT_496080 [Ustulina deusta]